jgi:tyrosine-specific transport protein
MRALHSFGHVLGGTLLIAATTIGVGMLGLPVATGPGGFFPSTIVYLVTWVFMLATGLLVLEVCSWMPKDANFITMTKKLLGPVGKNLCWALYLFLFVTAMIAHVAGGGGILSEITGGALPKWGSMIVYVIIFSPIVYLGTHSVDRINLLLMLGVGISYVLFITAAAPHIDFTMLSYANWGKAWFALPVLFTAFTYQLIIPTLVTYMEKNIKKVRLAIILGTTLPLIVYLIWEMVILGIVPIDGVGGLLEAKAKGDTAVIPLKEYLKNPRIFDIGKWFAFFTLTTSYIALALAFLDFLADGLKVKKEGWKKLALCLGIFGLPTTISLIYPGIFIKALEYAGGISCAVLFGLFPPLMVWMGRYVKKYERADQLPGGKSLLGLLILFVSLEFVLLIGSNFF